MKITTVIFSRMGRQFGHMILCAGLVVRRRGLGARLDMPVTPGG